MSRGDIENILLFSTETSRMYLMDYNNHVGDVEIYTAVHAEVDVKRRNVTFIKMMQVNDFAEMLSKLKIDKYMDQMIRRGFVKEIVTKEDADGHDFVSTETMEDLQIIGSALQKMIKKEVGYDLR